jgi:hypothetical protein
MIAIKVKGFPKVPLPEHAIAIWLPLILSRSLSFPLYWTRSDITLGSLYELLPHL